MKKTVRINASLLAPALRKRFDTMLQVAGRRSIVAWQLSDDPSAADVVLKEQAAADDERFVPIYVNDDPITGNDGHLLRLSPDFRVSSLMDTLDLAAGRVLHRWEDTIRSEAASDESAASLQYQIKHWVSLDEDQAGARYTHTLATMTQRPVTRHWMTSTGGLSEVEIDALLAELTLRGALSATGYAAAMAADDTPRSDLSGLSRHWIADGPSQSLNTMF